MLAQMNHSNMFAFRKDIIDQSEMISRVFEICVRKRFVILKMNIGVSKFYTYILMILTTMAENKDFILQCRFDKLIYVISIYLFIFLPKVKKKSTCQIGTVVFDKISKDASLKHIIKMGVVKNN
ncbi:hypothetical protein BpHYR1_037905 [Brachionus plicatilis]|uniref:Uncharacterized protein n=1 Tax=Brachionus plicatilis TaxID=10195 RepID=A0A3M7RU03_BRAPC|nr:hypothetical protein BpHYR1_037905 [Brachionus plicatilis]